MPGGHSTPKAHGYAIWSGGDGKKDVECDSLRCCHCGAHFWVTPGSGKRRGFCMRCGAVTCGQEKCDACVPLEQMLENVEKGRPANHRPIIVSPGGVVLG